MDNDPFRCRECGGTRLNDLGSPGYRCADCGCYEEYGRLDPGEPGSGTENEPADIKYVICERGHILDNAVPAEEDDGGYCGQCGSAVLTECPECGHPIGLESTDRAEDIVPPGEDEEPPAHCEACGGAFPWAGRAASGVAGQSRARAHPRVTLTKILIWLSAIVGTIVGIWQIRVFLG